MAIKKSELYSSLWESCDQLRGGMDASQYKDYILVLLFVKYVSDKAKSDPNALIEVPEGSSFDDMVALKGKDSIGDDINKKILAPLAEANGLRGIIDSADFNNPDKLGRGQEMRDKLSKLVAIFERPELDFSQNRAEGDDILGDAYEYLMRNFATESGKSKGQFYTPAEVSRIMAKVIGIGDSVLIKTNIYDPTCGSGSLLIRAADEAPHGVTIYGQEKDNATRALAKMNMILHGFSTAIMEQGNTLSSPHFKDENDNLKVFDFIVANPPFSDKAWSNGFDPQHDLYRRFAYGVPPKTKGDYAYLLHLIRSLKSNGKGAIILPHGVLFRGNVEAEIREKLVNKGFIKGIIGLPPNLFYGTGIPACIIVIDKENADARRGIFMIDASKGFEKDGNKNRLRHQDLHKIVDVFNKRLEVEKYSRMVTHAEIAGNEYNLNLPRYIDTQEPEDIQDIEAHLLGGIPNFDLDALESYWQVFPTLRAELFADYDRPNYSRLNVNKEEVKKTIFENPEFQTFTGKVQEVFNAWRDKQTPDLKALEVGAKPKALIFDISEDILASFSDVSMIDKYDVYQSLMSYWTETMQDDVYLIAVDGWTATEDLIPRELVIDRYFKAEKTNIEKLEAEREEVIRKKEELEEEHSGEDGVLDALRDEGKLPKGLVQTRVMELKKEVLESAISTAEEKRLAATIKKDFAKVAWQKGASEDFPELDILHDYLVILADEKDAKMQLRVQRTS
ncbi:MAG: type I restriction-modification system subunit M [Acidobacteria bacterium]|nr:type I restriction-modification system subunit M [Acidobacteriota bacterium]